MSEIRHVSYSDILSAPNAQELLDSYAYESSIPEIGPTNPQSGMYAQLETAGALQCFAAYDDANLVGFAAVLASVLPHYGQQVATIESLFVLHGHRGDLGRALMGAIEQYAVQRGCVAVLYSAPAGSRFEQLLTLEEEYRLTNSVFCRRLA